MTVCTSRHESVVWGADSPFSLQNASILLCDGSLFHWLHYLAGAGFDSDRTLQQTQAILTKVVSMTINQSLLQQKRRNHRTPLPKNMWSCPITRSMDAWSIF